MDEINHKEIVRKESEGKILIGIEPSVARKFFTDTEHRTVQAEIGEPLYIERFFVKMFFYTDFLAFITSMALSVPAIKWYSILSVPLIICGWFFLTGKASMGKQSLWPATLLVLIACAIAFFLREERIVFRAFIVSLPAPYFFAQLTYKSSTVFLRGLSIRNERAFKLLYQTGIFLKEIA